MMPVIELLTAVTNEIKVDLREKKNESVMVTCDEWFTLGPMFTHLKFAKSFQMNEH